jgi:hypothetical protein
VRMSVELAEPGACAVRMCLVLETYGTTGRRHEESECEQENSRRFGLRYMLSLQFPFMTPNSDAQLARLCVDASRASTRAFPLITEYLFLSSYPTIMLPCHKNIID